jgi:hypothetical protein
MGEHMATERFGLIKFAGKEQTVIGGDFAVGQKAPEYIAYMPVMRKRHLKSDILT